MADKDVSISPLVLQLDLLRSQVFSLEQTNSQLQRELRQRREDNQRLQDQSARWQGDSSNSSKPPSSDIVKPPKKDRPRGRGPRKIGGQKGHPRQERIPFAPEDIGPVIPLELAPEQAQGLIPLAEWFVLQQVDLVEKLYRVTETFGGILGSDSFSAYHKYRADGGVLIQFCWAHLIRDIRFLAGHGSRVAGVCRKQGPYRQGL